MEFDKVGRLQPIQSTRGFGLSGQPYTFQPPIKPKPKKRPKRRAKSGKIIYDNPRARYFRNQNLYGSQRGARIYRNNTNHQDEDGGLFRSDTPQNLVLRIEGLLDNKMDKELEALEERVERGLARRRRGIVRDVRALADIEREPQRQNEPIILRDRDRGEIGVGREPAEGEARGVVESIDANSEAPSNLPPDDRRLVVDVEPTVERGSPNRPLRDRPVVDYSSQQDSDSGDSEYQPPPQGRRRVSVVEIDNTQQEEQLRKQQEEQLRKQQEEQARLIRERDELRRRDREESARFNEEFSGSEGFEDSGFIEQSAGGGGAEREVSRVIDENLGDNQALRRKSRRQSFVDSIKKGLSRKSKEPAPEVFVEGGGTFIDNPLAGVGGLLSSTQNPALSDASSVISTDALERVLEGDRATDIDQQSTIYSESDLEEALD